MELKSESIKSQIRHGFIECQRTVLDILYCERARLQLELEEAIKHSDGVSVSKIIGRIELLRDLESKIFSLQACGLGEH
jgi:hypothetical protein